MAGIGGVGDMIEFSLEEKKENEEENRENTYLFCNSILYFIATLPFIGLQPNN